MLLTQDQINAIAARANWYVEARLNSTEVTGDPYIITGDGVDDLDRLIDYMPRYPRARFMINTGVLFDAYLQCDVEDIIALKAAYIAYYGPVNKPGPPVRHSDVEEISLGAVEVAPPTGVFPA